MQHDPLARHEDARREIGQTAVSRRVSWILVACFITVLGVPGVAQLLSGADLAVGGPPATFRPGPADLVGQIFATNRRWLAAAQRLEDAIGERSLVVETLRPVVQAVLTGVFGAGTELAYPVDGHWLFYGPDLRYVTGKGFLATGQLERRASSGDTLTRPPEPDPRPAILDLHRSLAARDIRLIVMPTPVKPSVELGRLSPGGNATMIENRSYTPFVDALRAQNVLVFDAGAAIREARDTLTAPLYLSTDTHWRPETMEAVAQQLAEFIADQVPLEPAPLGLQSAVSSATSVTNRGDIVPLLGLAAESGLFPPETVQIRRVATSDGGRWRPDPDADILLLGDSFTNVYSLRTMGWGESAGLAEHLSLALDRPVDRISQNDAGARASRDLLATELRRGRDRLNGKRVVVLQFANRELAFGDWAVIDLNTNLRSDTPALRPTFAVPFDQQRIDVIGTVRAIGPIPIPGSVPYKDQIVGVHVGDLAPESDADGAPLNGTEALVYLWGMRDNELTSASDLRPGSPITLTLEPWANVAPELEGINRGELEDPTIQLAEPWWGQLP